MTVEGYFHTHSFKKYMLRLLAFALISEISFDLMYGGVACFIRFHQNVIWTFLLALLGIHLMETVHKKQNVFLYVTTVVLVVVVGALLGTLSMVDYYGAGILTVFVFYLFRGRKWCVCRDKSLRFIGLMWKY
ncbi:MAG: TraX family protein [Lachnospiraceae bacterium]